MGFFISALNFYFIFLLLLLLTFYIYIRLVIAVKAGKEVVKSLASGVWNGLKAAGNTVTSGASSVVSSIGSFFKGLFSYHLL